MQVQIQKSHWQKVAVEILVLIVCNRNFNNCAALLCENSTNSLKVETRELSFYRLSFYILLFYSFDCYFIDTFSRHLNFQSR